MYEQYDIHIISLLILAVVLFNNLKNGGESRPRLRLFRALILCNMLLLVLNAARIVLENDTDGTADFYLRTASLFLCVLFSELWALFCTSRSGRKIKARGFIILSIPLFVIALLLAFNTESHILFVNRREKGPFFHAISAVIAFYVIYSMSVIWRGKKSMEQREYYPYIIGPFVLGALGIIKFAVPFDGAVIWPAVAVGMLILQLFALDEKMNIDHLTGLHNRKYLDAYIDELISTYKNTQGQHENRNFAALMLDIDNFKTINDTYGHVQGDKALVAASKLLKKSVRRGDFVARYGGDEFMIVLDRCGSQTPDRVIRRLKDNVNQYNAESRLPYELSFSIGCKLFYNVKGLTAKDIFSTIDELMYIHKQNKAAAVSKYSGLNQ